MPPTASASHSLDTPMMMQPATMLSRAEPTRNPWYSPTLMVFIQQVEAPHLPHTQIVLTLYSLWLWPSPPLATLLWCAPHPSLVSLSLTQTHFLWLSLHLYSLLLKTSHASLKTKLWFPLPLKIRKPGALALMTAIRVLQIWSQPSSYQRWHPVSVYSWSSFYKNVRLKQQTAVQLCVKPQ